MSKTLERIVGQQLTAYMAYLTDNKLIDEHQSNLLWAMNHSKIYLVVLFGCVCSLQYS